MTSIWCAWGEKTGICENRQEDETGATADVPFFVQMCNGVPITESPKCEEVTERPQMQNLRTTSSDARNLYYIIMRVLASENVTKSILLIRLVNSLIATLIIFLILKIARGRLLTAAISGITFVFVPLAFSQLTVATPKSWAVLGAMFSWVFLYAALYQRVNPISTRIAWFAYGICMFLVFATRIDATFFALFSALVILAKTQLDSDWLKLRKFLISAIPILGITLLVLRKMGRFGAYIAFPVPRTELPLFNYIFAETVQIFETSASVFGFGTGQAGGSPGIIGIISFGLFAFVLGTSLHNSTRLQFRAALITALFLAFTIYRGNNAIGPQLPGTYILAIPLMLVGFAVLFAESKPDFMFTRNGRWTVLSLLGIANMYVIYGGMEYYVRKGINTGAFLKLSLNGGWWWNTPVSPNFVFLLGAAAFPSFLWFAWQVVDIEEQVL